MSEYKRIQEAAAFIKEKLGTTPEIGMILGSGLGILADEIENPVTIDYSEIPHFPVSTVEGHAGCLVSGTLSGKRVLVMKGRFHYYEGYEMEKVIFPVRVMKVMGIDNLLVTNAAGGVNESYSAGDLMIISDHLLLCPVNPLRGANMAELGPRFPDMSEAYKKDLREMIRSIAADQGLKVRDGVYAFLSGPSYETPAEIRMARTVGADAVGMSTAPEVIAANHCGMRVAGISCITNMAAGILDQPLDHSEVMETAEKVRADFLALVREMVKRWAL